MKKLIFTLVTTIVVLTFSIFLYFWFQEKSETPSEALSAIPIDASFILKINNYHRFSETLHRNNHVWESLKSFTSIAKADSTLAFVDTLSFRFSAFNQLLTVNPVYISTHISPDGAFNFLATVKIPNTTNKKELLQFAAGFTNNHIKVINRDFENVSISTLIDTRSSSEILYFCIYRGLAICSSAKNLIESSIQQINNQKSFSTDPLFTAISNTAGTKIDANLFVNNKKIPQTFNRYLRQPYTQSINTLADIAKWTELDINLKDDAIFLNGFSQTSDSSNNFLKVFARQQPIESKISSVLPSETASFICLGISDIDKYLEDYRSYLDKKDQILEYTSTLSDLKKLLGADIQELYHSFFNKELALLYASFDGVDYKDCWYVAIKTNGQSQTKQTFLDIIDSYTKSNKLRSSDYKSTFKIDTEKSADIYKLPAKGLNCALFGSLFSDVSDEYFTFIDDYIIFGASKDALSRIIFSNIHNNQLQLDVSYRQFGNILTSTSNFFLYLNPHKLDKLFEAFFETKYSSLLSDNYASLSKIQGISLQLNGGSSMLFNNISVQYSPYVAEEPQTTWETRLDTFFTMKPQWVVNHITNSQEIIVQDIKNKLYLINDVGRILWTKQLPEPVIGEIAQIDLLKNNKLQYVFNTRSFLFAIDRRGSFVEGFPVKLKSKATNPVAIFDYEGNREYRFFVAGEDLRIYSFNNTGKPVTGWMFHKTERVVHNPLQYFRIKGKDYIVFADENRPYIVDRKGEERVSFPRYFSKSTNSSFILDESTKNHADRLVTTDSVGLIKFIYFNGKMEDLAIKAFSSKHVFDYQDVDSDGEREFLFLDRSKLFVYKQNKNLLFLYKFDTEINPSILNVNLTKSLHLLGFTSFLGNKIYLIAGKGSLYNGFPLKSCSFFSIGKSSNPGVTFNVLAGSSAGSLLSYSVK